jgi:hypothetical protein
MQKGVKTMVPSKVSPRLQSLRVFLHEKGVKMMVPSKAPTQQLCGADGNRSNSRRTRRTRRKEEQEGRRRRGKKEREKERKKERKEKQERKQEEQVKKKGCRRKEPAAFIKTPSASSILKSSTVNLRTQMLKSQGRYLFLRVAHQPELDIAALRDDRRCQGDARDSDLGRGPVTATDVGHESSLPHE